MAKKSSKGSGNIALDAMKRAFLIGLGATVQTTDRIKELLDNLVEQGELSQKEAKAFGEDLRKQAGREKLQFESWIKATVDSTVKSMVKNLGLVTRDELNSLRKDLKAGPAPAQKADKKPAGKKTARAAVKSPAKAPAKSGAKKAAKAAPKKAAPKKPTKKAAKKK